MGVAAPEPAGQRGQSRGRRPPRLQQQCRWKYEGDGNPEGLGPKNRLFREQRKDGDTSAGRQSRSGDLNASLHLKPKPPTVDLLSTL